MRSKLFHGAAAAALALAAASAASAQSTGSQEIEEVVVTAQRGAKTLEGVIVAEQASKSKSTVTQEFLATQAPGQTVMQSLNLMPAVNFTNNDAYGVSGGDTTIRGFDAQRVSLNVDGIQLNDTGNYQIYANQQLDPELIERASVNLGTTDVDSPTASATGGTINYVTRKPSTDPALIFQPSVGTDNYQRLFGMVETGEIGAFGTTAWFAASYTTYDKFRGVGDLEKKQYNARIYQPVGENGDFVALSFHWNENRNNTYKKISVDQFNAGVVQADNDAICSLVPGVNGARQDDGTTCGNYYNFFKNPSNTGNIRGQSRFTLADNVVLTVDPTFQYTLANGGGTQFIDEWDQRLQGSFFDNTDATTRKAHGVDLNHDGDILDRVRLYSPSNTNTRRYGVTSSLIWDVNDDHRLRFAYTWDRGSHRQTGEYAALTDGGNPTDVFGGKDGYGTPILTLDGDVFQKRNRHSIATLNQAAVEYVGSFLQDAVTVNMGLRAPFFERDLKNSCYQIDTFDAFCSAQPQVNMITGAATTAGAPVKFHREYRDVLPNVGATWRFAENQSVFLNYSENLSAPRTDDLYDRIPSDPEPETSKNIDLGYRWRSGRLLASASTFYSKFDNYIVRALTELEGGETIATSINVGKVDRWGADGQIGFEASDNLTLYASASYLGSEVKQDTPRTGAGADWPTKGKEIFEAPEWQFAARAQYAIGDLTVGLQAKWVDERWTNLVNDEATPAYTVVDADIRYALNFINEQTYLQLNIQNLLDEEYLADISTEITGNRTANLGAPRSAVLTLRTQF